MKIAREGYPWIFAAAILALVAFFIGWNGMGGILVLFALSFAGFFRDPDRTPPAGDGLVLAPADGKVVAIVKEPEEEKEGVGATTRVSIFLSLFDVHVNRSPIKGSVEKVQYQPGKFHAAYREDASQDNEQNEVRLVDSTGKVLNVVQIAGLLARRIICHVKEGETLERGQRFGLIMFGSRVDLFMPPAYKVEIAEGQRVKAGETIIGRL